MHKIKEIFNILTYALFPIKVIHYFFSIKAKNKILGENNTLLDEPDLLLKVEEMMLDIICRANVQDELYPIKIYTMFLGITINSLFVILSAESLSMILWVVAIDFPIILSISIVILFKFNDIVSLILVFLLDLDRILFNGFFQKEKYRQLVANDDKRRKALKAMNDKSTYWNSETLFRPALIMGSYQSTLDILSELGMKSPPPDQKFIDEIYKTYFSLEDKREFINYLEKV